MSRLIFLLICFDCVFEVFSEVIPGRILAFADLNYDRLTDLIVLESPNLLVFWNAVQDEVKFTRTLTLSLQEDNAKIINVGAADFDGDSLVDLAVTWTAKNNFLLSGSSEGVNVTLYWGVNGGGGTFLKSDQTLTFKDQPTFFDCNLDQKVDVFGEKLIDSSRTCYSVYNVSLTVRNFREQKFLSKSNKALSKGYAPSFIDLTGDMSPEIVLLTNNSDLNLPLSFEVWTWNFTIRDWHLLPDYIPSPFSILSDTAKHLMAYERNNWILGQAIFADFDADGRIDQLLPVCLNAECSDLDLLLWSKSSWYRIKPDLNASGVLWGVAACKPYPAENLFNIRAGDITQDGYPDLAVSLKDLKTNSVYAFVLENVPCGQFINQNKTTGNCSGWSRGFNVQWKPLLYITNVSTVAFIDLKEDGRLDLLIEVVNSTDGSEIHFVESEDTSDSCFLKVEIYTATCLSDCQSASMAGRKKDMPEGSIIPLPGAALWMEGLSPEGTPIYASAGQLPQFSFKPLILPYTTFGLGRTTNFVEKLKAGIPNNSSLSSRTWMQIIPNSRMYIVPYPSDWPSQWVSRLYVTPSRLILLSVAALAAICAVIVIIVFILHCREMRADKKEKLRQAHKFHFDAM